MIRQKSHHVLGNDGNDIVVFGQQSTIRFLADTTLIQGDGTFTCLVRPFTQLYIFHALLTNGVSYPLLYCLVKGKNEAIYERLLRLIEMIALEHGTTIFNRPVRVMVDFELAFITAARALRLPINVSCCFFHFVSNIKKRARPVIDHLKKTAGENALETRLGEKTKRGLVMLPLLPDDLITVEVVDLIIGKWKSAFQQRPDFDELRDYLVRNYVGSNASFKKEIWCACGKSIRTNNAAESSHAVLNSYVRVRGEISLDMFLFAIEKQMRNTKREIKAGCPSHTKAIYARRNELLAKELEEFLNGRQDVIAFLDRCSQAITIKNNAGIQAFRNQRNSQLTTPAQREWIARNRATVLRAAWSVHRKTHHCPKPASTSSSPRSSNGRSRGTQAR